MQYDLLSKATFEENEDDIPCSQTLEDTYITAVQVHDPSQSTSDIEVFRVTPEQDVEDWILAKVSLEGSQIQFNAPHINGQVVVLSEKLHQLGDILQVDVTCCPRPVSTVQCIVHFFEQGFETAKATVPFGTRLFEVFVTHHWSGQYYSEDDGLFLQIAQFFRTRVSTWMIHYDIIKSMLKNLLKSMLTQSLQRNLLNLRNLNQPFNWNLQKSRLGCNPCSNMGVSVMMR